MNESLNESGRGPAKKSQLVQSLSRGLGILSQFTAESRSLTLAELSRRTGIHRATVYRFVRTLEVEGFLTYDPDTGLYSVGPAWATALYSLGSDTALAEILNEDVHTLADAIRESVAVATRRGDQVNIILVSHSDQLFQPQLPKARFVPLNETWNVHAKIHLAYASPDTQKRLLATPAQRYTQNTLTDPDAIAGVLAQVAREGIAYDFEEQRIGVCAMAVPVFVKGDVVLALGTIVPVERFGPPDRERLSRELRNSAKRMESRLERASYAWRNTDPR